MPFIPYIKTTLTGYVMGTTYTAATDGIVNAYVTNSTTNQTFIGASNGVVLASMNNGAVGGLVQYSICFPVKAGAAWSVSGTMPTNPNIFFTPLSF